MESPGVDWPAEIPYEHIHDQFVEPVKLGGYGDQISEKLVRVPQPDDILIQGVEHPVHQVRVIRSQGFHYIDQMLPVIAGHHRADKGYLRPVGIGIEKAGHLPQENPDIQHDFVFAVRRIGEQPVVVGFEQLGLVNELNHEQVNGLIYGMAQGVIALFEHLFKEADRLKRGKGFNCEGSEVGIQLIGMGFCG